MPVPLRIYKKKIASLGNSKKISKAMEMISAVKMRRSIQYAKNASEYATKIDLLSKELTGLNAESVYSLVPENSTRTLYLVIGSNRGLCGNFNTTMLAKILETTGSNLENVDFIIVGKKLAHYVRSITQNIISVYENIPDRPIFDQVDPITEQLHDLYLSGAYEEISLIHNEPVSILQNKPIIKRILPFTPEINDTEADVELQVRKNEPNNEELLNETVRRLIEAKVFYAVLQSQAGENSARMIAMKNAGDAAKSMIETLTLDSNKIRQADITQKISEISNAAEVIK